MLNFPVMDPLGHDLLVRSFEQRLYTENCSHRHDCDGSIGPPVTRRSRP
jgi:hypothetical protein